MAWRRRGKYSSLSRLIRIYPCVAKCNRLEVRPACKEYRGFESPPLPLRQLTLLPPKFVGETSQNVGFAFFARRQPTNRLANGTRLEQPRSALHPWNSMGSDGKDTGNRTSQRLASARLNPVLLRLPRWWPGRSGLFAFDHAARRSHAAYGAWQLCVVRCSAWTLGRVSCD